VILSTTPARPQRPSSPGSRAQRGASFVELMLAVLVISTTVVGSTASMRSTTEVYHYFSDGQHEALMLAQEIHEAALLLPWSDGGAATFGTDVAELEDLDGKSYDPPRSAEYDVVVSHLGWSQHVQIKHVDLDDPTVEVDPDTFDGEMQTELEVTVKNGELEVGTFNWWLSEPTHD
jgi:hypothetical protein